MTSFKSYYRDVFAGFGFPLSTRSGTPLERLVAGEKLIGLRIPQALRVYYLVAGRERRFNQCFNRLLAPSKWRIDQNRLVFMDENQWVVSWGISARATESQDPVVWQGVNEEPVAWYREHRKCSVFLAVCLHYHAVSGGFRYCGSASASSDTRRLLTENGWTYYGKINSLKAFSRSNQVVCLSPFMGTTSVLAGAKTEGGLRQIGNDLGVDLT